MTESEFTRTATMLSNSCWVRHWMHWNYPQSAPWEMAISCRHSDGSDCEAPELVTRGFRAVEQDGHRFYVVSRTELEGSPFRSI